MATHVAGKLTHLISPKLQRSKSTVAIRSVAGHTNRNRLSVVKPRFAWSPSWRNPFPVTGHAPASARYETVQHKIEPIEPLRVEEVEASEALVEDKVEYSSRPIEMPLFPSREIPVEMPTIVEVKAPVLEAVEAVALPLEEGSVFRPKITVVGIGGGGCNAVNNMIAEKLPGVEFMVCNTDAQSLESSLCESRIQLGEKLTAGFGAGSNPEVGRMAAQESVQRVLSQLHGSHMVFLTAGLGGGTGTGAAPVIANACRNEGILTVAIVTMPFDFEGKRTRELAQTGLQKLQDQVDTVIVVPNQKLLSEDDQKSRPLLEAFGIVDEVLFRGIQGVTDLIVRPGLINTDFADLKCVMQSNSGRGLMGTGDAEGPDRAEKAAIAALEHPLLDDVDVSAARRVLVTISASSEVTMQEIDIISTTIQARVSTEALIIFGVTIAPDMGAKLRVSVVATDMAESASSFDQNHFGSSSTSHHSSNSFNRKRNAKKDTRSSSRSSSNNDKEEGGGFFRGWF